MNQILNFIIQIHGVVPKRLILVKLTRSLFLFENYTAASCKGKYFSSHIEQNDHLFKHFCLEE